jgi:hypothetical protein
MAALIDSFSSGSGVSDDRPNLARSRHDDEHQEYLLIGVDRKEPADG